MKYLKLFLFLVTINASLFGQSDFDNLEKYWYYRSQLRNFVLVESNYTEPGTNIPAERISPDGNKLIWDDGNGAFNQYISVLATEYRLLKNFNQDYSQTVKELFYAIKSFERLDLTAESTITPAHAQTPGDLNGYFIRNDMNPNILGEIQKRKI